MSGFPPLVGFFMKMVILFHGVGVYFSLYLLIVIISSVRFLFYVRLIVYYFIRLDVKNSIQPKSGGWVVVFIVFLGVVGVVVV